MNDSLRLSSARTEALDVNARNAIVQLCVAAHHEEDFYNLFRYVPSGGWHFLAHSSGSLVSHALVTVRWLQPQGLPLLKTAYIDAVATLPASQGQGYASALMRYLALAIEADYEIACLETDIPAFYQRLGWELWRGALAGRSAEGLIPTPAQTGILILRLPRTPPLDLNGSMSIECQSGRIW